MARSQAAGGGDFDTWTDETIECSRKLLEEELHNLYFLVNIFGMTTLTRMR
jgi:hypothetical protein